MFGDDHIAESGARGYPQRLISPFLLLKLPIWRWCVVIAVRSGATTQQHNNNKNIMAKPSPATTTIKPASLSTQTTSAGYTPEAWEQLEHQRQLLLEDHMAQLFTKSIPHRDALREIERQFIAAAGNAKSAHRKLLLLAVKNAGENGLLLADARKFIPEQKDLEDARDYLIRTIDENGNETTPLIGERQGKKNALRLFFIKQEDKKTEAPKGTGETEGNNETEE
jgi:hypothetical protein